MSARPVTLVTGARRGIGRAIAEALAKAGYDLALFNREPGAETEAACREATDMTAGVAAPYDARIAAGLARPALGRGRGRRPGRGRPGAPGPCFRDRHGRARGRRARRAPVLNL